MTIHHPIAALLGSLTALVIAAGPASADTFAVDATADTNLTTCSAAPRDCTLRGALNDANALPGPNTITLPASRISLSSALPPISTTLTIQGVSARASIIDGNGRVGTVLGSNFGSHLTLQNLEITGARRTAGNSDAAVSGGELLSRVAVIDNRSIGVFADNTTIVNSLIARNTGEGIGGIESMGSDSISNSTIADNTAALSGVPPLTGPLVWSGGVINAGGLMEIDHSTIAGNAVVAGAALLTGTNLGSVGLTDPATVVRSSLVGGGAAPNCGGEIDSNGHNVAADGSCNFTSAGDRSNVDPMLAPLADNGGQSDTIALLAGSPAIDAGDDCPATDQRGRPRTQGKTCDAGAFESPFTAATSAPIPSPAAATPPTILTAPAATPPTRALPRDTTPPKLTIGRIAKTITRRALRAGLKIRVRANEPIAAALELEIAPAPRRARTTHVHDLALTTVSLAHAGATRTVKLRLKRALPRTHLLRAQLRATGYDAAGNRSTKTIKFTVR